KLFLQVRVAGYFVCVRFLAICDDPGPLESPEHFGVKPFGSGQNRYGLSTDTGCASDGILQNVASLQAPVIDTDVAAITVLRNCDAPVHIFVRHAKEFIERGTETQLRCATGIRSFIKLLGHKEGSTQQWPFSPEFVEGHYRFGIAADYRTDSHFGYWICQRGR